MGRYVGVVLKEKEREEEMEKKKLRKEGRAKDGKRDRVTE